MGKRVLFINNISSMLLISGLLSETGYDVDLVHDVDSGLFKLANDSYDIIVAQESPAADSWITCDRIRGVSRIPLIVISLNASTETCVRAINAGADYFLRKPFGALEFLARINSLLQRNALKQAVPLVS